MKKPDFLIVGGHKCGTTALFSLLATCDRVRVPVIKEPHYFVHQRVVNTVREVVTTQTAYENLFSSVSDEFITGEASVLYLYLHDLAIDRIVSYYESDDLPLVVIMLRNPIERAFSAYCDARRGNPLETLTFREALAQEKRRSLDGDFPVTMQYQQIGLYSTQVAAYMRVFPRVLIIFFEDFTNDPAGSATEVLSGLDINAPIDINGLKRNEGGREWRSAILRGLVNNRASVAARHRLAKTNPTLHSKIRTATSERLMVKTTPPPEAIAFLRRSYQADIDALSELIGRDLTHWYEGR